MKNSPYRPPSVDGDCTAIPPLLYETAGVCISGNPGTGKSVLVHELIRETITTDETAGILLDPHSRLDFSQAQPKSAE